MRFCLSFLIWICYFFYGCRHERFVLLDFVFCLPNFLIVLDEQLKDGANKVLSISILFHNLSFSLDLLCFSVFFFFGKMLFSVVFSGCSITIYCISVLFLISLLLHGRRKLEHTKTKLRSCLVRIAELLNQESLLILLEQEADW